MENSNLPKWLVLALVFLVAVFLTFSAISKRQAKKTSRSPEKVFSERGSLLMTSDQAAQGVRKGQTITLTVSADSDNNPVRGYDIVLTYDKDLVLYQDTTNLVDDFTVVAVEREGRVVVTGFEKPGVKKAVPFSGKNIAQITFIAQKTGKAYFDFLFEPGKTTDSNLVDASGVERLGKVAGINLEIK